jgi:hypothetical protein
MRFANSALSLFAVSIILALPSSSAVAEDKPPVASAAAQTNNTVNLKAPEWQAVLDRLFGTPDNGLVDGTGAFRFQAEDLTLTTEQSAAFFAADSPQSLSALIEAVEALHGTVRLEGIVGEQPFELKIAGRELKLEGLTLTEAQRQALVNELKGISGLHEMKIQALVDGRMTVTKVQGNHEKLEIEGRSHEKIQRQDRGALEDRDERANRDRRDHVEKIEIERPEKPEKVEIHERIERSGRIDRIERIEKPERGESGRH